MNGNWQVSLERSLSRGNAESAMWLLDTVEISELDKATEILNRYEKEVMTYLLTLINLYGLLDRLVGDTVLTLHRARITWPDFKIVLKSMHAEERARDKRQQQGA